MTATSPTSPISSIWPIPSWLPPFPKKNFSFPTNSSKLNNTVTATRITIILCCMRKASRLRLRLQSFSFSERCRNLSPACTPLQRYKYTVSGCHFPCSHEQFADPLLHSLQRIYSRYFRLFLPHRRDWARRLYSKRGRRFQRKNRFFIDSSQNCLICLRSQSAALRQK